MFVTEAVPFQQMGNRRVLTEQQLVDQPHLRDFVRCFAHCFEHDGIAQVWRFYPDAD